MIHILVVEDDDKLNKIVCTYLNDSGFEAKGCLNARDAYDEMYSQLYDLIISDIMMPEIDGFEFARTVRKVNERIPILFMSAKDDLPSKQRGFRLGIDDYMVKPFGVLELSARIRSLLRRTRREAEEDNLCFEKIRVNRQTREVFSNGRQVELTLKEFELLVYLMENQTRVVTRDELLNQIWGYEYDGETRTLDMHIRTLRQKLGEEGGACIRTVRGVGYRMVHPGT